MVTVDFDLNYSGATGAPDSQEFEQGCTADEPVAPTRTNYTFVGWFEANSSTAFDFDTEVNEDKTLYAHWQLNPPTVEQLGDIALEVICDQHDNKDCDAVYPSLTEATEYSKTGFIIGEVEGKTVKVTLKGEDLFIPSEHFADKDETNITELTFEYDDDTEIWSPVSGTHLVAVRTGIYPIFVPGFAIYVTAEEEFVPAEKVNINFHPGEADTEENYGKMPFVQVEKGSEYTITPNLYEYEGYNFVNWKVLSTAGLEDTYYDDEDTIDSVETSMTLVAQWEPIDVTIKFDPNASSLLVRGEMDDQTVKYGVEATLNENQFERIDGYAFVGWNTQPDGEGTSYTDKASITVSNVEGITLYAQWEYASVVLTYNANGGKGFMWPETYSKGTEVTVKDCAFTAPAGQEFVGWSTSPDGKADPKYAPNKTFEIKDATILYAQWNPIGAHGDLKVTYHANGGTGDDVTDPPTGGYAFDTTVTVKSNPFTAPDEMKFVGWSESPIGEAMVHPGDMFILNKNTDLYAIWKYLEITPPDKDELTGSRKEALTAGEVRKLDLGFIPGLMVPENGKIVMSAEELAEVKDFAIAYKITIEGDPNTAFKVTEDKNVEWYGIDGAFEIDEETNAVSGRLDDNGRAVLYCVKTFDEDDVKDREVENTATIINESNPNQKPFEVEEKTKIKTEGVTVTKTLNSNGPFEDGDDVEFTITVTNLGNEDVEHIIVVEEPGDGLRWGHFVGVREGADAIPDEPVLLDESGEDEFTPEEKSTDEEIVDNDNEGQAADNGSDNEEAADNSSEDEEVAGPEEQPAEVPAIVSDIIAVAEGGTETASEASSDEEMPYLDEDGNVVIPVLHAGQSIELTYVAEVTDRDDDHSNTVIVTDEEGNELDKDTNDEVKITSIDIDKEINENDTHPKRGGWVNYTITVTNDGEVTLTNINVYEYPGKVFSKGEFVGFSSDANVSVRFDGDEAVINCLNPGESVTLTYKAKVDVDASKNEELKNYVEAEATTNEGTVKDDDTEDKGSVYVPSGGGIPSKDRPTKPSKVEEVLNTEDHFQYVQGYPDNTVGPERNITRAEATVIFFRLLNDSVRAEYLDADN
ncbi:MAG: InlB B-repeat-containing protein, partial [Anaerotignum sp.]